MQAGWVHAMERITHESSKLWGEIENHSNGGPWATQKWLGAHQDDENIVVVCFGRAGGTSSQQIVLFMHYKGNRSKQSLQHITVETQIQMLMIAFPLFFFSIYEKQCEIKHKHMQVEFIFTRCSANWYFNGTCGFLVDIYCLHRGKPCSSVCRF